MCTCKVKSKLAIVKLWCKKKTESIAYLNMSGDHVLMAMVATAIVHFLMHHSNFLPAPTLIFITPAQVHVKSTLPR